MWDGITEAIGTIFLMFFWLGLVGFLYYILLVVVGLANIGTMIMGAIGIFVIYVSIWGEIPSEINEGLMWLWNPYCIIFAPIYAFVSILLIWQIAD